MDIKRASAQQCTEAPDRKQNYIFGTIHSLYDIVCIEITFVIMIVPFLNCDNVIIGWCVKKVKQ